MKIAVTGATGQLGQLVITQLVAQTAQQQIVALARHPEKAQLFKQQGIEVRAFDYSHPVAVLAQALQGIEKILLISSSEIGQRTEQHQQVIEAAKQAGVQTIVYTSLLKADSSPLALADEHIATEQLIKASGLDYTILRNGWYSENYVGNLAQAITQGVILGATQHGKISSATRLDYATAAANVLLQSGHSQKIYELAGDASYTLDDLAQLASDISQKTVVYRDLLPADYHAALIDMGLAEAFAAVLANSDAAVAKDGLYSESKDLQQLLAAPTTPIRDSVINQLA